MDLTMSMFSTQADYWKSRADLAEATVRETASALGCKPDNEVMLAAAQDAVRYQKLRALVRGERHLGTGHNLGFAFPSRFDLPPPGNIMRGNVAQHLDAAIDALPALGAV